MSSDPQGAPRRFLRQQALPVLTKLLHGSAPFISTFLLIHLTAPMLANLGGSSLASQTMLLGREYYQTDFGEKYLLLGPLAVHALSGLTKRLLSPPSAPPRPWMSLLSLTGYANMLLFLPVHFATHRILPTTPAAPIHALGPSELDFEYVKYALAAWPDRSWLLYGALVACAVLHAVDGDRLLFDTYLSGGLGRLKKASRWRVLAGASAVVTVPVLTGLLVMAREPLMVLVSTAERFRASFALLPLYRI
ncbi:hypothetical protein B0H10DRAFT_2066941 [Mycena sp. CBHHK59/15]|nr:hypothetical protein B0H10DRAFT_2066941 [Mycena sp. CBHHK59/15]